MITDVQLGLCANVLGVTIFVLVVLYHWVSVNNPKKLSKEDCMQAGLLECSNTKDSRSSLHYSEDPAYFDPDSFEYRIWCNISVTLAFFIISAAQFLLVVGLLSAGIVALGPLSHDVINTNVSEANEQYQGAFAFERWPALVYFRLVLALLLLIGLIFALISFLTIRPRLLTFHITVDCIAVVSSVAYVALLAWHCAVERDYFAFCFVGLSLLLVLLVNVLAAHCGMQLQTYMSHLSRFIQYASVKWPHLVKCHQQKTDVRSRLLNNIALSSALIGRARAERSRSSTTNRRPLSSRQSHCSSQLITSVIHESPEE